MSKFYRVKKDTPLWLAGAILEQVETTSSDTTEKHNYHAISDIWESFENGYPTDPEEYTVVVENNPDWYERVYDVKILGKLKYLTKEKARKVHDDLYKGDEA